MARTNSNAAPALDTGRGAADKIQPATFANLDALLARIPNLQNNPQSRTYQAAYDAGRSMIMEIAASFGQFDGTPMPADDRFRDNQDRGRNILLERIIGGMTGNFGYALAYADAAANRLADYAQTEERDRDGVAGFASKAERLLEAAMERDAQAAWIGWIIKGAAEAFEETTGSPFKLYVPADPERNRVRTEAEVKKVASSMADFLAARRG